ncbi:uncharacterized protein EKO05_0002681 [Ascochyta rabiei]|uniref:uncharacterized protein n=1 Tax=Didymella rabiei TaxID=5454 RepID=UPI0018FF79E4|nr:uncharacterized protein EKO05_0002681 [Ascochyta rabiei]UPX12110.1 hypothetical protein EKO05_0002681 [Ascochyta rabiei]
MEGMRGETAESNSGPTFRSAASRFLRPNSSNDHSAIHYTPAQTNEINDIGSPDHASSTGKQSPHVNHGSVDATSTANSHPDPASHVFWNGLSVYALTWEFLGIVISILFLILGAFVANLRGQNETDWSKRILQATRIAPSIWPILFSGVLGNAVRRFANWRAERGIQLLALEHLMGSLTMAGSFIAMFTLSMLKPASLVLVVLWAFNPLGSQASFRGIYLKDVIGYETGKITHYNPSLSLQMNLTMWSFGMQRTKPTTRALYSTLLYDIVPTIQYVDPSSASYQETMMKLGGPQSAAIQAAMDSWGNVRIPHLEYAAGYDPSNPHEWVSIPWTDAVQNYSSLMGARFEGVDRTITGNTTFNMTSSYQTLDCSPWINIKEAEAPEWTLSTLNQNFTDLIEYDTLSRNSTIRKSDRDLPRTFWVASSAGRTYNRTYPGHPRIFFGSGLPNDDLKPPQPMSVTSCGSATTYVDVQVTCISKGSGTKLNCGVDAMRKMHTPPESEEHNLLESWRVREETGVNLNPQVPNYFLDGFMDVIDDNQGGSGVSSVVEWYLQDPSTAFGPAAYTRLLLADLKDVDIKTVEQRLSLLYNTLWQLGWTFQTVNSGNWTRDEGIDNLSNVTSHTIKPLEPVYELDIPWLTVYFVSVGVMFLAAAVSLILHAKCTAPPILGYVSSLIRDSVFFGDSGIQGNSMEGGASKASRLGKMEVKIADVWSEETVGRVAFAPAQGRGVVKKGRWYE